ncbi:MAG: ABC transporter permease [Gemmatimonadaceae bacterium]|nr:ABC transporter permease [Gemmatimonadaceae bacterium]
MRSAWRAVRRRMVHSSFIVATLALGVSAVAAALSVATDAIDDAVPFDDPHELVWIGESTERVADEGVSLARVELLRRESRSLVGVAAYTRRILRLSLDGATRELSAVGVTSDFFTVLRVQPAHGRLFARRDDEPSAPPVAVVSHAFWRDVLRSREDLTRQSLRIDGDAYTVIGVAPQGFEFPVGETEVWIPVRRLVSQVAELPNARIAWGIGRLRPGATPRAAEVEVTRLSSIADAEAGIEATRPFVTSLRAHITRDLQPRVALLIAAAFLILGLAAASVANLFVGRFLTARRDTAVRAALGEPSAVHRARFFLEYAILAVGGLLVGLLLALTALSVASRTAPSGTPEFSGVSLSESGVLAAVVVSVVLAILLPLVLLASGRTDRLPDQLRAGAGISHESVGSRRIRDLLLAAEVAATLVLLVSSTALVGAYLDLARLDLGFTPSGVAAVRVARPIAVLMPEHRPSVIAFFNSARAALRDAPGIQSIAFTTETPARGNRMISALRRGDSDSTDVGVVAVTPEFFEVLRIPMRRGRPLSENDERRAENAQEPMAVIDEVAAARLFGAADPVGEVVHLTKLALPVRIAGVAARVRQHRPGEPALPQVYVPYSALAFPWATALVRSRLSSQAVGAIVEQTVRSIDPAQPIGVPRDLVAIVADRLDNSRVYALLLAAAAGFALLLTATGLYGVVNMRVSARMRELAIRAALGATARDQIALVVSRALLAAAVGVGVGLVALFAGDPLLTRVLYGVSPMRRDVLAAGVLGVGLVVTLASLAPTWRAAKADPASVLRAE